MSERYLEAKASGSLTYLEETPCRRGHNSPRLTSNRTCIECNKLWRENNPEYQKQWYRKNPEQSYAKVRRHRRKFPEKHNQQVREWTFKRQESIAGRPRPLVCEACGEPPKGKRPVLCFDHDHITGKFRGWLCNGCNRGLGYVGENPATLRALAAYIEKHAHALAVNVSARYDGLFD